MSDMFIELTHSFSGDKVMFRADSIITIRVKEGKTLILNDLREMYVRESADEVRNMIGKAMGLTNTYSAFVDEVINK